VLSFPNQSRAYDAATDRIRFWGHDGALEVTFFLQLNALFRLYPRTSNTEAGILAAFDEGWNRICEVAANVRLGRGASRGDWPRLRPP
jgi:hypothetical protein